jgi:hypothetical protein
VNGACPVSVVVGTYQLPSLQDMNHAQLAMRLAAI